MWYCDAGCHGISQNFVETRQNKEALGPYLGTHQKTVKGFSAFKSGGMVPKYRPVHTKIWSDKDFRALIPNAKLIFFYFITTEKTVNSGIWEEPLEEIAHNTKVPLPRVKELLANGCLKNVTYDFENEMVFVHNFQRFNTGGRPDLVEKGIISEFQLNFKTPLWNLFLSINPYYKDILPTLEQPLVLGSLPLPLPLPDLTNNGTNPKTIKSWFEKIWNDYPEKHGKDTAFLKFKAQIKTIEDFERITTALENYKIDMVRVRETHPERAWLYGQTWFFKRWKDYIEIELQPKAKTLDPRDDPLDPKYEPGRKAAK